MRILLITTSWDYGGAEIQVKDLALRFAAKGNEVAIVSMIPPNQSFLKKFNISNIQFEHLNMRRGLPSLSAIKKLRGIVKSFKPDVLHAHMVHAVILARVTRVFIHIPKLVSTAHNINEGSVLRSLMYRLTDFLSDVNTNVSKIGTELYIKKGIFTKAKTRFLPNGIQTNTNEYIERVNLFELFGLKQGAFIFIAVGRLEEAKDYLNMLEAIKVFRKTYPKKKFYVLIAGKGSLRNQISAKISEYGLDEYVKLIGRRNDVLSLLKSADAFIMSSAWEGLPISILEALSMGTPCVVTDVGGCSEAVIEHYNGFLAPPKNPKALAEKMNNMMTLDNIDYQLMKQNSLEFVKKNYDLNIIVAKWLALYKI